MYTPAKFKNEVYKNSKKAIYVTRMATDFNADGNLTLFTICGYLEVLLSAPVEKMAPRVSRYPNVDGRCW